LGALVRALFLDLKIMKRSFALSNDMVASFLILAISLFYFIGSHEYDMGSVRHMGPGYLPRAYAIVGLILSVLIFVSSIRKGDRVSLSLDLSYVRAFSMIVIAISAFALIIPVAGLIPAAFVTVVIASLGSNKFHFKTALGLAIIISVLIWLLFSVLLGLPMPGLKGL
jgi:hypothetical protein